MHTPNIDIALLRSFVAVAETGQMTAAAKVVNRSQGAVSQQIMRLEQVFGLILFERRKNQIAQLTREGEKLLAQAHRLLAMNDAVVAEMRETDFAGEVRLGVPHDVVGALMPPILRSFRQQHPNVLITLVSDSTKRLRATLREGGIDLTLTTEPERADRGDHLMTDQLVWVGARGGDAGHRRPLSVALGREDCGFRAAAVRALVGARIKWRPICQVGSLEPVFATLEADMAVAPFLGQTVPERLEILTEAGLPALPFFSVNLRVRSSGQSAVTGELARHIRDAFERRYPRKSHE
ncbi:MAG TPA: LysR family transcriptional regulator [Steroidobacteraceae bacterium]|jgi:DNA-binding transcriptional LysR family regulator|nr:LysR family transcriptional regulator [Steroidobacteraceae bacterium]